MKGKSFEAKRKGDNNKRTGDNKTDISIKEFDQQEDDKTGLQQGLLETNPFNSRLVCHDNKYLINPDGTKTCIEYEDMQEIIEEEEDIRPKIVFKENSFMPNVLSSPTFNKSKQNNSSKDAEKQDKGSYSTSTDLQLVSKQKFDSSKDGKKQDTGSYSTSTDSQLKSKQKIDSSKDAEKQDKVLNTPINKNEAAEQSEGNFNDEIKDRITKSKNFLNKINYKCDDHYNRFKKSIEAVRVCSECRVLCCNSCVVEYHHEHIDSARMKIDEFFSELKAELNELRLKLNNSKSKLLLSEVDEIFNANERNITSQLTASRDILENIRKKIDDLIIEETTLSEKLKEDARNFYMNEYKEVEKPLKEKEELLVKVQSILTDWESFSKDDKIDAVKKNLVGQFNEKAKELNQTIQDLLKSLKENATDMANNVGNVCQSFTRTGTLNQIDSIFSEVVKTIKTNCGKIRKLDIKDFIRKDATKVIDALGLSKNSQNERQNFITTFDPNKGTLGQLKDKLGPLAPLLKDQIPGLEGILNIDTNNLLGQIKDKLAPFVKDKVPGLEGVLTYDPNKDTLGQLKDKLGPLAPMFKDKIPGLEGILNFDPKKDPLGQLKDKLAPFVKDKVPGLEDVLNFDPNKGTLVQLKDKLGPLAPLLKNKVPGIKDILNIDTNNPLGQLKDKLTPLIKEKIPGLEALLNFDPNKDTLGQLKDKLGPLFKDKIPGLEGILNIDTSNPLGQFQDKLGSLAPMFKDQVPGLEGVFPKIYDNQKNLETKEKVYEYLIGVTPKTEELKVYNPSLGSTTIKLTSSNFQDPSRQSSIFPLHCRYVNLGLSILVTGGYLNDEMSSHCNLIVFERKENISDGGNPFNINVYPYKNMNEARERHNIISMYDRNLILVCSGFFNKGTEITYLGTGTWHQLGDMNEVRANATIAYINNRYIYVFGGFQVDEDKNKGIYLDSAEVLDLDNVNTGWKLIPSVSPNIKMSAMGVIKINDNTLLLCGGFDGVIYLKEISKVVLNDDNISQVEKMDLTMPGNYVFLHNSFLQIGKMAFNFDWSMNVIGFNKADWTFNLNFKE